MHDPVSEVRTQLIAAAQRHAAAEAVGPWRRRPLAVRSRRVLLLAGLTIAASTAGAAALVAGPVEFDSGTVGDGVGSRYVLTAEQAEPGELCLRIAVREASGKAENAGTGCGPLETDRPLQMLASAPIEGRTLIYGLASSSVARIEVAAGAGAPVDAVPRETTGVPGKTFVAALPAAAGESGQRAGYVVSARAKGGEIIDEYDGRYTPPTRRVPDTRSP